MGREMSLQSGSMAFLRLNVTLSSCVTITKRKIDTASALHSISNHYSPGELQATYPEPAANTAITPIFFFLDICNFKIYHLSTQNPAPLRPELTNGIGNNMIKRSIKKSLVMSPWFNIPCLAGHDSISS